MMEQNTTVAVRPRASGKWGGWLTIAGLAFSAVLLVMGWKSGVFTSTETLQSFLRKGGLLAPVLFIALQIVQVVIPIIPGGLTCVAGVLLFGPVWGFIYNYTSICAGSCINFYLAKQYGKPFVEKNVSEKTWNKYFRWLESPKFDKLFTIAIFLPVAPDDFLCLLAGLTPMKFKKFLCIILLGKPTALIVYSLGLTSLLTWLGSLIK